MARIRLEQHKHSDMITLHQEGSPGLTIHEGDLSFLLRALTEVDCREVLYSGRIGVTTSGKTIIMYNLERGARVHCVVMDRAQATRFVKSVQTRLSDTLNAYSPYTR